MTGKKLSTFDREMKNVSFRKKFQKKYKEFLLSELESALIDNDNKAVRKLAEEAGLSL